MAQANPSPMETINRVLKDFVDVDKELETRNLNIMEHVKRYVIDKMTAVSPLFEYLYQEMFYTGSYYDNLRVKQADEFDLDVILNLPFKPEQYTIIPGNWQGYFEYCLRDSIENTLKNHSRRCFLFDNRFDKILFNGGRQLLQNRTVDWLQQIIAIARLSGQHHIPGLGDVALSFSRSGPAWTMKIILGVGDIIDVDLVLAIRLPTWPNSIKKKNWYQFIPKEEDKLCMLIPKPSKTSSDPNNEWRISLPRVERYLLQNKQCVKPLIRITKALRDIYDWQVVASYHIKTLFLIEIENNLNSPDYWNSRYAAQRFIEMLTNFHAAVDNKKLPNIFFPNDNMFANMDRATADIIKNTLARIIKRVQANFNSLYDIFDERKKMPYASHGIRRDEAHTHTVPVQPEPEEGNCIIL